MIDYLLRFDDEDAVPADFAADVSAMPVEASRWAAPLAGFWLVIARPGEDEALAGIAAYSRRRGEDWCGADLAEGEESGVSIEPEFG